MRTTDVAIIGAGIGGLALAYYLKNAGLKVEVFEAAARVGGVIHSLRSGPYLIEEAANSTLPTAELSELIDELKLQDMIVLQNENCRNRFVLQNRSGKLTLTAAPKGPIQAITSPLLPLGAKFRALIEPCIRKGSGEEESVHDFIARRLGESVSDNLVAAALSGIWAGNIHNLSAQHVLPKLWEAEATTGSIVRGMLNKRRGASAPKTSSKNRPHIISFRDGMSTLPRKLELALGSDVVFLNTKIESLEFQENLSKISGRNLLDNSAFSVCARSVCIATSANAAANLVQPIQPKLSQRIHQIPYAPLGILALSFPKTDVVHPLDGFGFVSSPVNGPLLGAIFSSSLFPGRAPEGEHLLTCFVGGILHAEMANTTDPRVQQTIIDYLCQLIGARSEPKIVFSRYWEKAIPNYILGHGEFLKEVSSFQKGTNNRLQFLGNWLKGVSVASRVSEAKDLAQQIQSSLS